MKVEDIEKDFVYAAVIQMIKKVKKKKDLYVLCYTSLKILVFIGGTLITVLTGWKGGPSDKVFTNYVLITSASIALITLVEGLFNLKDKAMGYDLQLYDFRRLRDRIIFSFNQGNYDQDKEKYFFIFEKILESKKEMIESSYSVDE